MVTILKSPMYDPNKTVFYGSDYNNNRHLLGNYSNVRH